ncbi:PP2C family protein-serine/threonine phosphatase [Sporohalobacter salinus]|uniref:PP2C family protein-serine/threonine phosphatase n=1 Tax=Sporohalobacter salinus TaxID=1494606 RepID=UPI00195FE69A|nr:PP2C family protein-serine/threonine phosphatase [Sporohalobacter salinus]MBM7624568.1 hypothetical protein [Sporohalobacter salinus]
MQVETGTAYLAEEGEELCGDSIEIASNEDSKIIVLSDGLGSGVKANILSTLTTRIARGLLENGISIEEVVDTITQTLPVCQERQLAYSTLSVLQVFNNGQAYLIEIDNPPSFYIDNQGNISQLEMEKHRVGDKEIKEAHFQMSKGDMIMLVSDGVVHAGIGGLLNFGLGWEGICDYLKKYVDKYDNSHQLAQKIIDICKGYYCSEPGDDTTAVVVKYREEREVTIFTGPPKDKKMDAQVVDKLRTEEADKKVICGGTTAQIVARELDKELEVKLRYYDPDVPPVSKIEGIDLVTEGLLTLNKTLEKLEETDYPENLPDEKDGATQLTDILLRSDNIKLLVGRSVNPAHQSLNLPEDMGIRKQIITNLADTLREKGKEISIEWF